MQDRNLLLIYAIILSFIYDMMPLSFKDNATINENKLAKG